MGTQVYARLWCVLEFYQATQMGIIDVRLLGSWSWEGSRDIDPQKAECNDPDDTKTIRTAIENTCGWDVVGRGIVNRIAVILATREEWPQMRPWEWKVLEGISRNDASYIHEAIAEPHVNWEETVGRTYGDPNDRNHVYHQVQSFGGLRADEGNTLLKIA